MTTYIGLTRDYRTYVANNVVKSRKTDTKFKYSDPFTKAMLTNEPHSFSMYL